MEGIIGTSLGLCLLCWHNFIHILAIREQCRRFAARAASDWLRALIEHVRPTRARRVYYTTASA